MLGTEAERTNRQLSTHPTTVEHELEHGMGACCWRGCLFPQVTEMQTGDKGAEAWVPWLASTPCDDACVTSSKLFLPRICYLGHLLGYPRTHSLHHDWGPVL
jgi:hypothetical protein